MNLLLRTILSSTWAIDDKYASLINPVMQKLFSGASVDLSNLVNSSSEVELIPANYSGLNIAVIEIEDVLMRADWCGEMGTESIDHLLQEYAENSSIGAVILAFNSPGGQTEYIENLSNTVKNFPKPIVSYVSGICASAAYWIASGTDAIFTSVETDRVGSIGTMISYYKVSSEATQKPTYEQVSVYASRSIDKNRAIEEMLKGDHERVIKEVLDPINSVFLQNVQENRNSIDQSALTGKMYLSSEAIQLGLIDGMKSFEEVISYVTDLIINSQNSNQMRLFSKNKNPQPMKNEKFSNILGRDVMNGEALSAEDYQAIQDHIEGLEHLSENANTEVEQPSNEEIASLVSTAVASAIEPLTNRISAIETAMEVKPIAESTSTNPISEDAKSFDNEPWNDPNRSYNKLAGTH